MSCLRTQRSGAGDARTHCPSFSSQALYHCTPAICILMDFPIHSDIISMGLPIVYFQWSQVEFYKQKYSVFLSLKVVLILANSTDHEMQHYAAFHLDLHCLPKYWIRGFQYIKG